MFKIQTGSVTTQDGGWGLGGFSLNGGGTAGVGIDFNRARYGRIGKIGVHNLGSGGTAYYFNTVGASAAAENTMFIKAAHLAAKAPTIARFEGSAPTVAANCCHITIDRLDGVFGSASNEDGIVLKNADNVTFIHGYLFRAAGTGFGVRFGDPTQANSRARSCVFVHLQPGGGVLANAPNTAGDVNRIIHYDRENGQSQPTVQTGAQLEWSESSRLGAGYFVGTGAGGLGAAGDPANSGYYTHKIQNAGKTNVECFVESRANSSVARYDARAKDSGGNGVRVALAVDGSVATPRATLGTISSHDVLFLRANGEVFRVDSNGDLLIVSGKYNRWVSGNEQTTVGAAGGASVVPCKPDQVAEGQRQQRHGASRAGVRSELRRQRC